MSARGAGRDILQVAKSVAQIRHVETICDGEHFVQFYQEENLLIQTVARYVAQGFAQGHSSILVVTRAHRLAIEAKLAATGLNVQEYQRCGLYYAHDAAETLACFMVDGHPNPRRFRATIEPVIEVASQYGSSVRAFGEMVAILWAEGKKAAAIELEILWNDLMEQSSFALLCAYPVASFTEREQNRELRHICRAHHCVIPHEDYCDPSIAPGRSNDRHRLED